ncbi:hypothetical protein OEZ85_011417 [Tetradesmus obliquus]|uniref:SBP-type domain-containing protein n=1 Tax=Tetradesmus obliquus TaxID=3088 RepID=A0ABY8TQA4_TETOB|nr:hypothetical protein OEZ85_011417 [Tetradesmus obliquus]
MDLRQCQGEGCMFDLMAVGKPYNLMKRICPYHMKADVVHCTGSSAGAFRYCQQCGRLEPLYMFDGHKRSCRVSLEKRRSAPKGPSSSSSSQQSCRRRRTDPAPQLPADVLLAMGVYDEAPVPGGTDGAAAAAWVLGGVEAHAMDAAGVAEAPTEASFGFSGCAGVSMASASAVAGQAGCWGAHAARQAWQLLSKHLEQQQQQQQQQDVPLMLAVLCLKAALT